MSDWQALRSRLRGADMITESAQADGLPIPDRVFADRWKVEVQVGDRAAIEAWAGWRGWTIHPTPTVDHTGQVLRARGEMYDVPVEVYAVVANEPAAIVCGRCSHPARVHTGLGCTAHLDDRSCPCSRSAGSVELDAINAEPAGAQL